MTYRPELMSTIGGETPVVRLAKVRLATCSTKAAEPTLTVESAFTYKLLAKLAVALTVLGCRMPAPLT